MDLTPIYAFIGIMVAVFAFGLVIIDHKPIKTILLAMMLASLAVGFYLHTLAQDYTLASANTQIAELAKCQSEGEGICNWSTK